MKIRFAITNRAGNQLLGIPYSNTEQEAVEIAIKNPGSWVIEQRKLHGSGKFTTYRDVGWSDDKGDWRDWNGSGLRKTA